MNSTMAASTLMPLDAMRDRLLASVGQVAPVTVPLAEAVGLVASETVLASAPRPVPAAGPAARDRRLIIGAGRRDALCPRPAG